MRILDLMVVGLSASAVLAFGAGCSNEVKGTGGAGGAGTTSATNATSSSSKASSAATTVASSSSTGMMPVCTDTTSAVYAVSEIFFGDTDFNGNASPNAWKAFGFDVDGKVSTAASTDLCQPVSPATKATVYPDGDNGIDNAFGKSILPIVETVNSSFSTQGNAPIQMGDSTLIIKLDGLGAAADQADIVAKLYGGAAIGSSPKFDGTDCWPVTPSSLTSAADIQSAKIQYGASQLVGNHWDSGGTATITIPVALQGYTLELTIHDARVSMDLDATHKNAMTGQIGGVLDTAELQNQVKQLAGSFNAALCNGPALQSILAQIAQASDIMSDGSQNVAATCNGISVGFGFKATRVNFGAIGADPPAPTMPCP